MSDHDDRLSALVRLEESLGEPAVAVGDPDRLLGVVRLEHVVAFHLHRDDEVRHRVRVRLAGFAQLDVAWHLGGFELDLLGLCLQRKETYYVYIDTHKNTHIYIIHWHRHIYRL